VIGDSKAGPTTGRLGQEPVLLHKLQEQMTGVETKLIHVIRNPFDPISLMMIRGERTFTNAIDHYFAYCETLTDLHNKLDSSHLMAIRYENFIKHPKTQLAELCDFLGVAADANYLDDCTRILYDSPEQSRQMVDWNAAWIKIVEKKIDEVEFLAGYRYDN